MIKVNEEGSFIGYLKWLLEESEYARASMANLRHGLGKSPGTVFGMDRYILSKIPENVDSQQEGAYYLVSSLFAFWHEGKDKAETIEGNLGQSLRAFVNQENDSGKKENLEKSIEKRLNALLNSHYDELPEYLRRIIALLKSKDIPVNWVRLLVDIIRWEAGNRFVQHAWARGFWSYSGGDKTEIATASNPKN